MNRKVNLSALAIVALAGSSAGAQVIDWASATSGDWNLASNWIAGGVPDTIGEDAVLGLVGGYTVDASNNFTIGALSITNPLVTLNVGRSRTLTLNSGLFNDGSIIVNPTGTLFNAHLSFAADTVIAGAGSITLNAQTEPNDAQILINAFTLTHPNGHTIRGTGHISGAMINSGNIIADVPGGVGLRLAGTTTQTATGSIGANGGTLILAGGSVTTGGLFNTINGGAIEAQNTATIGNIINAGTINIPGQTWFLALNGDVQNDGIITVNSNSAIFNAHLRFDTASAINGSGTVQMLSMGDLGDAQLYTNGLFDGTIGANQTVAGSGRINGDSGGTIVNLGTINANHAAVDPDPARALELLGNHAGGGIYRSDDSVLGLGGGLILTGGTIETTGVGIAKVTGSGIATISGVTNNGQMGIDGQGGSINLDGILTNNGTLTINSNNAIFNAHLRFGANTTIDGTGTISMIAAGNSGDAQLFTDGPFIGTIGASQTVQGSGQVDGRSDGTIVNHGMISGNDPLYALELRGNHTGSGMYRSDDGVLALINGANLDGGTFDSSGTGIVELTSSGIVTLSNITNIGQMGVRGQGGVIELPTNLTNNGNITLNTNGAIFNAHIRFVSDSAIDGTGTINMTTAGNSGDAQIIAGVGFVGTIGAGQFVSGDGRLVGELNMDGSLDPGGILRRFDIDTMHMSATSAMTADLGGLLASEFDRLLLGGADTIDLDGALAVNLDAGYLPEFGDSWDIISGGSVTGEFASEVVPESGIGLVYRVIYEPSRVFVVLTCAADLTGDNVLDFFDISLFLNYFTSNNVRSDLNGDGTFDFFDISLFLQIYNGDCL